MVPPAEINHSFPENKADQADFVELDKEIFLTRLKEALAEEELSEVNQAIFDIKNILLSGEDSPLLASGDSREEITYKKHVLISELNQIIEANSLERTKHYLSRLKKGVEEVRTNGINDINLNRWKEYEDVITDSLWVMEDRDRSGAHIASYWGNFIPQIPNQLMKRYTQQGDWVLDPFSGSGTTLIECRRLDRNGVGLELDPEVAEKSRELIEQQESGDNVETEVYTGDSRGFDIEQVMEEKGLNNFQLLLLHPPYHDIIEFTGDERDLSRAESVGAFVEQFSEVLDNTTPYLESERFLGLVIGDKYTGGEWIPLGYRCMQQVLARQFRLKSIVVKNFNRTRGKRSRESLWRYRALAGGYYVFKHEYIFIFEKTA